MSVLKSSFITFKWQVTVRFRKVVKCYYQTQLSRMRAILSEWAGHKFFDGFCQKLNIKSSICDSVKDFICLHTSHLLTTMYLFFTGLFDLRYQNLYYKHEIAVEMVGKQSIFYISICTNKEMAWVTISYR